MTTPADLSPRQPGLFRRTLRHRIGWLALWLIGSALTGALIYLNVEPVYRAASLLRVDSLANDLYTVRANGETQESFMATQIQLISSPAFWPPP